MNPFFFGIETKHGVDFLLILRGNLETECLSARFPLPTLLYAEYSVKLKKYVLLTGHQHSTCHKTYPHHSSW